LTKVDGFAANVSDDHDAAFMKLCIGDIPCVNGDTPIETMWTRYRDMMTSAQAGHPGTILVWWTIPIIASDDSQAGCNQELEWFNDQVRAYVNQQGGVLFDVADIESHDLSGNPVSQDGYEAMYSGYSIDGAHLNETGRQQVARALWHLLVVLQDR
jgi:hypothetical protein